MLILYIMGYASRIVLTLLLACALYGFFCEWREMNK